ncbi:hypothetical protein GUJ93_ZPchr0013g36906 [Zizania palustris]|uniref:Uncharacterized protein n=1 Tax=Zizania palustris TaxID=103762 RepID=A0A8J6BU90_ZIZPA|nr:hypothetical protein GUJ93_ZPchr0013g36906 [Zizania palustris]
MPPPLPYATRCRRLLLCPTPPPPPMPYDAVAPHHVPRQPTLRRRHPWPSPQEADAASPRGRRRVPRKLTPRHRRLLLAQGRRRPSPPAKMPSPLTSCQDIVAPHLLPRRHRPSPPAKVITHSSHFSS